MTAHASETFLPHSDRHQAAAEPQKDAASFTELLGPVIRKNSDAAKATIDGKVRLIVNEQGREVMEQALALGDGRIAWVAMEGRLEEKGQDIRARVEKALIETTTHEMRPQTHATPKTSAVEAKPGSTLESFFKENRDRLTKGLGIDIETEQFARDAVNSYLKGHAYLLRILGGEPDTLLKACALGVRFNMQTPKEKELIVLQLQQVGGKWPELAGFIRVKNETDPAAVRQDAPAKVKTVD